MSEINVNWYENQDLPPCPVCSVNALKKDFVKKSTEYKSEYKVYCESCAAIGKGTEKRRNKEKIKALAEAPIGIEPSTELLRKLFMNKMGDENVPQSLKATAKNARVFYARPVTAKDILMYAMFEKAVAQRDTATAKMLIERADGPVPTVNISQKTDLIGNLIKKEENRKKKKVVATKETVFVEDGVIGDK